MQQEHRMNWFYRERNIIDPKIHNSIVFLCQSKNVPECTRKNTRMTNLILKILKHFNTLFRRLPSFDIICKKIEF